MNDNVAGKYGMDAIIIVDDDSTCLKLLSKILSLEGYEVMSAENTDEALGCIQKKFPALIILDIMMQDMNGYDFCRMLKNDKNTAAIPVIFCSALTSETEKMKGFSAGCVDYITKPFNSLDVLARVGVHFRMRRAQIDLETANSSIRRINEQISESEEKFKSLFIAESDAIFLIDFETLVIMEANPAAQKMYGYSRKELLKMRNVDISAEPNSTEKSVRHEAGMVKLRKHRKKDGTVFPVEITGSYFEFRGKKTHVAAVRDISERVKHEEEMRRYNAELEKRVAERTFQLANNFSEMESFSYSISHDLRAPLRAITGFAQIISDEYSEIIGEKGERYISRITANCDRMAKLIDAILTLSKMTRVDLEKVSIDIVSMADSIIRELAAAAPGRKYNFISPEKLLITADETLIRTVFFNLIENSWKYTSKCDEAVIELGIVLKNGRECLFLKDNGIGFEMKSVERLFDAFQRLHEEKDFSGIGIGLSIVQKIIRRHGGSIWAESEKDKGATFYFSLDS